MKKIILTILLVALSAAIYASENNSGDKVNARELILEHISDSHEWHIATFKGTHITIPLPILLIYEGRFYSFMSSEFHHASNHSYKGFKLNDKGKIVHYEPTGEMSETTVWDFSMTKNVISLLISISILLIIFLQVAKAYRKSGSTKAPHGLQNLIEPVIMFIRNDIAKQFISHNKIDRYMPYLVTLFFFILVNNLMGLIPLFPGGANVTGNISITFVLALITFIVVSISGNRDYWTHIFNFPGVPWFTKYPLPLMQAVEFIGMFTKPIVLMIRLFANITAGHMIALGFLSVIFILGNTSVTAGYTIAPVSVLLYVFISVIELLVAFIQAYIFTILTALYIGDATITHEHGHTAVTKSEEDNKNIH